MAAIFSNLIRPLYLRFLSYCRGRKHIASGLTVLTFFLLIILPLFGFFGLVAKEATKVAGNVTPWVQENLSDKQELNQNLRKLPGYQIVKPYREQAVNKISSMASGLGNFIFKKASTVTAGTFFILVNFAIMLYAMFFFFTEGPEILAKILYYMPLKNRDEKKVLEKFESMSRSTIKVLVIIGVVQGSLAGMALWAAGIPSALFWGTIMAVLSVVPNVGSAVVWLPAVIYLFVTEKTTAAILVFLWCALVVGSADNVIRPILVGKDTKVDELLVLISTLGGLTTLGLEGFILGPVLAVLFLTIWEIYGTTFKEILPEVDLSEK